MITRENYEAFYLDFLEGTLSRDLEKAFLAFLEANPDLQIESDEMPMLSADDDISLTSFEKLLLKKGEDEIVVIGTHNIDYFLVAQLEGQLNEQESLALTAWLTENPSYLAEQKLYQKTLLVAETIPFTNKRSLFQETKIIPLWAKVSSAAASIILLIGISAYLNLQEVGIGKTTLPQFSKYGKTETNDTDSTEKTQPVKNNKVNLAFDKKQKDTKQEYKNQVVIEDKDQLVETPKEVKEQKKSPVDGMGIVLPKPQELAESVTVKNENSPQSNNDYAFNAMQNPIQPITSGLSKRLNTEIDFRKSTDKTQASGFYLKIGKFEFLHKKGGKH